MPIPIVVIGRQRSGTTVYRELLARCGAIDRGEIFHSQFVNNKQNFYCYLAEKTSEDVLNLHPTAYPALFNRFLEERVLNAKAKYVLVDVKYNALRYIDGGMTEKLPAVIRQLNARGASFLHVRRRNKLRVYVSVLVAMKTGRWSDAGDGSLSLEERMVDVPPLPALESVQSDIWFEGKVAEWIKGHRGWEIDYEDMFDQDGAFSDKAIETAGQLLNKTVTTENAKRVTLKRQNPEPLNEVVRNFDQLKGLFDKTPHTWMLSG
jgi:LPS sulfotransferase NodH